MVLGVEEVGEKERWARWAVRRRDWMARAVA